MKKSENLWQKLGPGLITGASDDDPSGILTYLQAGVILGFQALWTALLTLPLMYGIQEMAGRIGLVTEKGLVRIIKENYPKFFLVITAGISSLVMIINIGADLSAVGIVLNGLLPVGTLFWLALSALAILFATIFFSYQKFSRTLKWLTFALFFYVLTVFYLRIDWGSALKSTLIPQFSWSKDNLLLLAAIFGTTVSPYLFFWQANEEVEEEEEKIRQRSLKRLVVTKHELKNLKEDTFIGMFLSNLISWFIIAAAAHLASSSGLKVITNFQQASLSLKPLLGNFAYLAFSLGIVGTGFLAIPILAGNIGYMLAEIFNWSEGLNKKFREARGFYLAITLATGLGLAINFFGIDPIQLLIATAVLYAFITPPIIYLLLKIANNQKIMKDKINPPLANFLGWLTFIVATFLILVYLFI